MIHIVKKRHIGMKYNLQLQKKKEKKTDKHNKQKKITITSKIYK